MSKVIIVGAGIFGLTAAVELVSRGYDVDLLDPGPIPHPDASSTDISKVLRMDYGADTFYLHLMKQAFDGWDAWNEEWKSPLYHETGVLMLSQDGMSAGGYEYESFQLLNANGFPVERMSPDILRVRYPAWQAERYLDGYFNPRGGWAESGKVVQKLLEKFTHLGGKVFPGETFNRFLGASGAVYGLVTEAQRRFEGDRVVLAAGAWTPYLHPDLDGLMWPVAQDILHFRTDQIEKFQPPRFPVFTADVSKTGWYGFPAKDDGTIKIANHGIGRRINPSGERKVLKETESKFRSFFRHTFPDLVNAEKIYERVCFYADTFDGDFWIAKDPVRKGLVVASGGCGHAFKFAPVLGPIIADVIEGRANPTAERFGWRTSGAHKTEFARYEGD